MTNLLENAQAQALNGGADAETVLRICAAAGRDLLGLMAAAGRTASLRAPGSFTCGIVNAKSGRCQENCSFCAQSAHHRTGAATHPLVEKEEMLRHAERLAGSGVDYMGIVTSGIGPDDRDLDSICAMAGMIRERFGLKLCASLGLLDEARAVRLRQSGFTSYHHNLETAASFYPRVCTSHSFALRVDTVRAARKAGLRVCAGGIFGVGESWEQRAELSLQLRELGVDSIPVNFLTPISGTPLEHMPLIAPGEALASIALLRLMHPGRDIVVCGGRSACLGRYDSLIFPAGANGMMVGDYLTTGGKALAEDRELFALLGARS